MLAIRSAPSGAVGSSDDALKARLEEARGQLEERFLEGGGVLVTVLETLSKLVGLLEQIGGSLNDEDAHDGKQKLQMTAKLLSAMPDAQKTRRARLTVVEQVGHSFPQRVASMEEALRYLRTFAITAKIAGASIPDFTDFAAEIMERIQFASNEVKILSDRVKALEIQIRRASAGANGPLEGYFDELPGMVTRLSKNGEEIDRQRNNLAAIANKVAELARKAQAKVGQTLSAMQIGDITRQRIEHCQTAFDIADECLNGQAGADLTPAARAQGLDLVRKLVALLLTEATNDYHRDSNRVVEMIRSLSSDVTALMKLYQGMLDEREPEQGNAISVLHGDLVHVRGIVAEIGKAAANAEELGRSTADTVNELTTSVETIQLVRRDIQYMALNTTLRCSRLGEEGRAINVVTGELRAFASVLDDDAGLILASVKQLKSEAAGLRTLDGAAGDAGPQGLGGLIDEVIPTLAEASEKVEQHMETLRETGQEMSAKVMRAMTRLDFRTGIGEILSECVDAAQAESREGVVSTELHPALVAIGERIGKTYTMVAERNIHALIFGHQAAPAPAAVQSDDDLLEDALF